jgi:hypothetical protein
MKGMGLVNPSQQFIGPITKGLSIAVEPEFIGELHRIV